MSRWSKTRVGKAAEPQADILYPLIKEWVLGYCNGGDVHPVDVAAVAAAVVDKIADDEDLYRKTNAKWKAVRQ